MVWCAACCLPSQTFSMPPRASEPSGAFGIYAGASVMCILFVAMVVPETKGKSLEEIKDRLMRKA
ncbi:MAG: MFS transporter [Phycisphaerae bacterium]|nr:MFS transporter [Phycisphaerae bacterium]